MNVFSNPITQISKIEPIEIDNKQNQVKYGDIFFTTSSETPEEVGMSSVWLGNKENIYLNSFCFGFRPIVKNDPYYMAYMLRTKKFRKNMILLAQGISRYNISKTRVMNIDIQLPSDPEQKKLGKLFCELDNLITLHQRKYDKLVNLKKSMLEKMFPKNNSNIPEIRFKGFTKDWEQRKLGDTKTFYTDGNYGEAYPKEKDLCDESIGVPFLRGGNLKGSYLTKKDTNFITKEKHNELQSGHLKNDDIVIAVRGTIGSLGLANPENEDWNINSQLAIIRTDKEELYGIYLVQFLLSNRGQAMLHSSISGSALKQLPIGQLKNINIPITSLDEQKQIGKYFKKIDNLITLHQRK